MMRYDTIYSAGSSEPETESDETKIENVAKAVGATSSADVCLP